MCLVVPLPKQLSGSASGPHTRGRGTYTAWTVNSVPLSKLGRKSVNFPSHFWWLDVPKMQQIAQICNYIFTNFPGVTQRPQTWGRGKPFPRFLSLDKRSRPTVPLFQSFRGRCHTRRLHYAETIYFHSHSNHFSIWSSPLYFHTSIFSKTQYDRQLWKK